MKSTIKSILRYSLILICIVAPALKANAQEPDKILMNNGRLKEAWVTSVNTYKIRYRTAKMHKKALAKNWDSAITQKKKLVEEQYQQDIKGLDPSKEQDKGKIETLALKKAKKLDKLDAKHSRDLSPENVFSITSGATGEETVIYSIDTLGLLVIDVIEPEVEFTVPEMRKYIQGRIDGRKHKTPWATLGGVAVGIAGSFAGAFYSPIVPAAYIGILASRSPNIDPANASNQALLLDDAYQDGYTKSARRQKVKNATISSFASLAVGVVTLQLILR